MSLLRHIALSGGLLMLFFLTTQSAMAQFSNERLKHVAVTDSISPDSLSIIPGSLKMAPTLADLKASTSLITSWKLNAAGTAIRFNEPIPLDSVWIQYRVFPFRMPAYWQNKDLGLMGSGKTTRLNPISSGSASTTFLDDSNIQKSGNISRGIAFGNAQNLSVNSTLNLQLSGRITERYQLLASISDDNIPIQPNGNTQQLQDFDQVYIQIFDERTKLIAGDFILKRPSGYFMNYFKRAQGLSVATSTKPNDQQRFWKIESSASISKGRFARNSFNGVEGNQGPYRLTGADGETFIIILAGTEAVYIDGQKLERGQDKDYVIDYNAAEITFTPKNLITKDRRIVVEFQYSDRRYSRPLLHTNLSYGNQLSQTYLNLYSENDAKNQPLQQDLDAESRRIMTLAGDDIFAATISGADSVGYSSSQVLYALVDSLGFDTVWVFSTNSAVALYRVQFSAVGQGNGDYVEDGFTANGKKFKWIAPVLVDGVWIRQGNYAPIVLLTTPKKKQMIAIGHEQRNIRGDFWKVESVLSINDLNTFSEKDSNDDVGLGFRGDFLIKNIRSEKRTRRRNPEPMARIFLNGKYEYTSMYFSRIERFREVEFERNWNLLNTAMNNDLHWAGLGIGWAKERVGNIELNSEMVTLGNGYQGYRGVWKNDIASKGWIVQSNASILETQGTTTTSFVRHKAILSKTIRRLKIGFKDDHEWNRYYDQRRDSLNAASYQFYDWQVELGTADSLKNNFSIYYRDRTDWKPSAGNLARAAHADQYGVIFQMRRSVEEKLNVNVSNRRLRVVDPELFTSQPENTLVGRIEYYRRAKNGWITSSTFYEIGSGLEQKKEFIFFEVPAGQGSYVWIDYNSDGVKDLNEFEIAQFAYEANYIRTYIQSTDYIRTYTNQFTQSFQFQQGNGKKQDSRWSRVVGKFSDNVAFKADRKTSREDDSDRFNPLLTDIADSVLIAINSSFRNVLFFNKSNPKFGLDYTIQQLNTKNLLSNGFESRNDQYQQFGWRWNFFGDFSFLGEANNGRKEVSSDFLNGRNYVIAYTSAKPRFSWQNGALSKVTAVGEWIEKRNTSGTEKTSILKYGIESSVNSPGKGVFSASVNFYNIQYNSSVGNSLAFDMLEGLNPGFNATWTAGVQRTVANNLQLTINYFGRKPEGVKTIHSGGLQMRAFF
ncbi:MAG: hypothetical protein ACOYLH_01370 [Flavobacteriales bacterium]